MGNEKFYNDEWNMTVFEDYQPFDCKREIDLGYAKATYYMTDKLDTWAYGENSIQYKYVADLSQEPFKSFDFSDENTFESDAFFEVLDKVRCEIENKIESESIFL